METKISHPKIKEKITFIIEFPSISMNASLNFQNNSLKFIMMKKKKKHKIFQIEIVLN